MAILPDPIANLDADGRLIKLHCGTPEERCNTDQAKDKRTVTWAKAMALMQRPALSHKSLVTYADSLSREEGAAVTSRPDAP